MRKYFQSISFGDLLPYFTRKQTSGECCIRVIEERPANGSFITGDCRNLINADLSPSIVMPGLRRGDRVLIEECHQLEFHDRFECD